MRRLLAMAPAGGAGLLALLAATAAFGQAPATPLDDDARRSIVEAAATALRDRYVDLEVGEQAAVAIEAALAAGSYDAIADPAAFAARLSEDLEHVAHDKHMYVSPPAGPPSEDANASARPPRPASEGGVTRADLLADDIGYVEVFAFAPVDVFTPPLDRAMAAVADTRALIVDIRRNIGGDPASVNHLLSYFVESAPILIGSSISRTPGTDAFTTEEYRIEAAAPVPYTDKPVFVLTSAATFSGGEAFASHMQNLDLGTLVGETTAGAANIANTAPLAQGFVISVPYARGTGPTWEGVGVSPDIAAPGADALRVALERLGQAPASGDIDALAQASVFTPRTTPAPGAEATARRLTEELQRGEPDYALLNERMGEALRGRASALHDLFAGLGPVEAVTFVEIDPFYGDVFDMKLADGSVYWAIALDPEGKVVMWEVVPRPAEQAPDSEP